MGKTVNHDHGYRAIQSRVLYYKAEKMNFIQLPSPIYYYQGHKHERVKKLKLRYITSYYF